MPKRIRVITCDVTGTLVSFRGTLEEHYLGSAAKCGVTLPEGVSFASAFHDAYKDTCQRYPCFGGSDLTAKEWWKECVNKSFQLAGAEMTSQQEEDVFQRIYSIFGSQTCYEKFEDATPFLNWAQRHNIICGVLSNADERYGDSILPMLGLSHDQLQFQCFSKDHGIEKPNPLFFKSAIEVADRWMTSGRYSDDPLLPSHVLHIGNDYAKDFEGARRAGMHAVLLERYNNRELAEEWRRRGAFVMEDLLDVVELLGRSDCRLG